MGFALRGMITGAASALSDIMDDERKSTSAIIANRTKIAYENYLEKQRADAALMEEIRKRDAEARLYDENLTEAQRIAIGSDVNNVFLTKYKQILEARNPNNVKLGDLIKFKDQVPEQAFDAWVKSSATAPVAGVDVKPVKEETMLGMSAEGQIKETEKYASSVGLSASELMAYEKPAERTVLSPIAYLNQEALKLPESPEDTKVRLFNTLRSGTPDAVAAAKKELAVFGETQRAFDELSGNVNWASKLNQDRAKAYAINNEPNKYSEDEVKWASNYIKVELDRELAQRKLTALADKEGKVEKDPTFVPSAIKNAIAKDMEQLMPFTQNGITRYRIKNEKTDVLEVKDASDETVIQRIKNIERSAPIRVLAGLDLLGEDGELKSDPQGAIKAYLYSEGFPLFTDKKTGKTYVYNSETRKIMAARANGTIVDVIKEAIALGKSPDQIIASGLFKQEELDAAGVKKPAVAPPPPPPKSYQGLPPIMSDPMQIAP